MTTLGGLGIFAAVAALTAALTAIARVIALRVGFVARPRADRWGFGDRVIALGGGIPLILGLVIGLAIFAWPLALRVAPPLLLLAIVGFVDDLRDISPAGKLIVQAMAASALASVGLLLPVPSSLIAILVTVAWLVGISNSLNFLDNMDGLSSGVALVCALSYAALCLATGAVSGARMALCIAGAAAGFLLHNARPARIFMGDAGSLPLGMALAALACTPKAPEALPWWLGFGLVLLPLAVPLLDTCLVAYTRHRAGRSFLQGGRDHTSHRLVALGLTEGRAVAALMGAGAVAGGLAWAGLRGGVELAGGALLLSLIAFPILAVFLADAPVSKGAGGGLQRGWSGRPDAAHYALEVGIDTALVTAAWTAAHYIRFQDPALQTFLDYLRLSVVPLLPLVIAVKLGSFFVAGLIRGIWRSMNLADVYAIFRGASLGTLVIVLASALEDRLANLSRVVIVLDWLLTFCGMLAVRGGIRMLRALSKRFIEVAPRAALVGPPALRELARACSEREALEFVGVIGESPAEEQLGTIEELEAIIAEHELTVLILLPGSREQESRLSPLIEGGLTLRRLRVELD